MSKRQSNGTSMRFEDRRTIDQGRTWFVVATEPHRERAAAMDFIGRNMSIWLPHYREVTIRRRQRIEASALFFPGYLFAGLDAAKHDVKTGAEIWAVKHVAGVLGGARAIPMPAGVLQVLADRMTGNVRSERLAAAAAFRVGEMRTVKAGPFASFMAEITEILANGRIMGDVTIFGRPTPVEFDPAYLGVA